MSWAVVFTYYFFREEAPLTSTRPCSVQVQKKPDLIWVLTSFFTAWLYFMVQRQQKYQLFVDFDKVQQTWKPLQCCNSNYIQCKTIHEKSMSVEDDSPSSFWPLLSTLFSLPGCATAFIKYTGTRFGCSVKKALFSVPFKKPRNLTIFRISRLLNREIYFVIIILDHIKYGSCFASQKIQC